MGDAIFVVVTVLFFSLCGLYVRGCEWVVRSTEDVDDQSSEVSA